MLTHRILFLTGLLLALAGCGGGGSGGVASGPNSGAGGTGIASVSGFGSVIFNDTREFEVGSGTRLFIDDNQVSEIEFENEGLGLSARYIVADDANSSLTAGTLIEVRATHNVKGPVTSLSPLRVLGQTVVVTGDTILRDVPGNDVANLSLDDIVEVSGYDNETNVINATGLQFKAAGSPEWKLLGTVTAVTAGGFSIGPQTVTLNGVVPRDCGTGVVVGNYVEVKATEDPGFDAVTNNALDTVTDVECQALGLTVPGGAPASLKAEVEGIVTGLTTSADFEVRGQRVVTTASTTYEGGTADDILLGARLEAEGSLNTSSGTLTASKIRFRQTRVRIEAPVTVPGGGLGAAFAMLDIVAVNTTPLTEDADGLVDGSGPSGNLQVEVRGFVDSTNQVFAERVRERGAADPASVRLRGPATDTCNPAVTDQEFAILGVIVDTSATSQFFDSRSSPSIALADDAALCALISIGTPVQAENGVFSSAPAPRIDSADLIEIED